MFRSRGIMVRSGFGELGPMNSTLDSKFGSQFGAGSRLANVPTGVFEHVNDMSPEPRPFVNGPVPLVP